MTGSSGAPCVFFEVGYPFLSSTRPSGGHFFNLSLVTAFRGRVTHARWGARAWTLRVGKCPYGLRCAWRGYGGCDRRRCGRSEWEVHVQRDGLPPQATPAGLVSYGFDRLVSLQLAPCFPCVVACLPLKPSDRYHAELAGDEEEPAAARSWQSQAVGAVHGQSFRNGLFAHRRRGGRPGVGLLRLLFPCRQPRQQGAVCARALSPSAEFSHCCDGFFVDAARGRARISSEDRATQKAARNNVN